MSDTFKLRIFTPAGLLLDDQASSVYFPSSNGEIGILPNHTQYTGLCGTGILSYSPDGSAGQGSSKRLVISGGFCTFRGESMTILADAVYRADTVDSGYASERQKHADTLKSPLDTASLEWQVAKEKLARIEAIDELLGN